jgi:hypothetical protein
MNLTPGQVQGLLSLSRAAYRHWKEALPPLADRNGHTHCFSLGDLFAMALVKAMADDAGVQVGALRAVSTSLFQQCAHLSWAGLERSVLVVELARMRAEFAPEAQTPTLSGIGIIVPCAPIVADLRERLLMDKGESDQASLRFPPNLVSDRRAS